MAEPARLARARAIAELLDAAFTLPIVGEIGFDGIVGLLPVAGDWLIVLPSTYIVYQGYRLGVPKRVCLWMLLLVAAEAVLGSVPILGDLFDIAFKANRRNVARIERYVDAD
ncbi:DUF4112 domain-containing protein [Halolamina sp. CBA1230]|uniref:DUF4112 domain-containing protein n=1 Tax=Halolamina sp. CBA1230 TaxID=1853690 RepID=UPI0009A1B4A2|nr:DUF4112 domain-containing protein [Halolamina sp. CBA1230]QKY18993.1 DUF4112 domain-containing protein [Halolamina sp. CBA1230]